MTNRHERLPRRLGPYELTERVGEGGMGVVYKATDKRLGTAAAVKVIHENLRDEPGYLERFRREAHVASLLTSPYIVQVIEFGFDKNAYYLATEYVTGTRLAEIMAAGRMDPEQALSVAAQVTLALAEADIRGVIHRDIKPENIIITPDGSVKLMDFGIARLTYARGVTEPGLFVGTVAYSAPEQFRGQADIRSDIYSLGVVLFQMLAGEMPFQASTIGEMIQLHAQEPPPLSKLAHLPQPVIDVVSRCLAKNPDGRFQRPSEFLTAIEIAREAIPATKPQDDWVTTATIAISSQHMPDANSPERQQFATVVAPSATGSIAPGARPATARRPVPPAPVQKKPPYALYAGGVLAAIVVLIGAVLLLGGGGDDDSTAAAVASATPGATDLPGVVPTSGLPAAPTEAPAAAPPILTASYSVFGFSDSATATSEPPPSTVPSAAVLRACNPNGLFAWIDYANAPTPAPFTGRWFRDGNQINETTFTQTVPGGRMFWSVGAPLPPATYSFEVYQETTRVTSGTVTLTC